MKPSNRCVPLVLIIALLTGCAASPRANLHYTLKDAPGSRPLQRVVLLPVEIDVYEMSAGGVREEVPEWGDTASDNVRSALLVSRDPNGACCVTREVDSGALTPAQRETLEEHLALFETVAANAIWAGLPANAAWHFKSDHFDYTLGDGLAFLSDEYDLDAGLVILGEDVVTTAGRKATAVVGAILGVAIPMGHSMLIGGLVDFRTGDLLWLNYEIATGGTDLRDPESCLQLARELMQGYPAPQAAGDGGQP